MQGDPMTPDALTIAREHLARREREASDTECSACGMRNPPTVERSDEDGPYLAHDGCGLRDSLWTSVVQPYGWRSCLGVEESTTVCEAVVALAAKVERLRAENATLRGAS